MLRPLTIALVQFKPSKGDYDANLARIGELLADCAALDPRPDVVHLPETALTGYFVEGGVRDLAVTTGTAAEDVDASYRAACARRGQDVTPLARRDCVRNPRPVFAPAVAVIDASPPVQPSSPVAAGEKTLPPTAPPVSLDLAVMQERYPLLRNAL